MYGSLQSINLLCSTVFSEPASHIQRLNLRCRPSRERPLISQSAPSNSRQKLKPNVCT